MKYRVDYESHDGSWKLHSENHDSLEMALSSISADVAYLKYRIIRYEILGHLEIAEEGESLTV